MGSSPLTRGKPGRKHRQPLQAGLIPAHAGKTSACRGFRGGGRGSSPLTRGKPTPCIDRGGADRLIPAHAGKTSYPTKPRPHLPAHPRSRGENDRCDCRVDLVKGSSPLTRGKLLLECCGRSRTRLIPAHAGKTRSSACLMRSGGAHPRSRGENPEIGADRPRDRGSSPLTRGKPGKLRLIQSRSGLIPAHAGKTARQPPRRAAHPAHPRSRGENLKSATLARNVTGSSPLTRGKPHKAWTKALQARLIPAHAGKTAHSTHSTCAAWAHPRSRGENSEKTAGGAGNRGSSPLTRGKQRPQLRRRLRQRLIPAHAGKTGHDTPGSSRSSAHPRSRGENPSTLNNGENVNGSSPLTRGKPSPSITSQAGSAAHPRSRGENKDTRSGLWESMGSSPLTRGKPLVFGDLLGNERLIPAHAGKTTWTTPCSRPTAAHPRSRGENRKQPRQ